jgi:hypothetical protein
MIGLRLKDEAVESLIAAWDRDYDLSKTSLILAHLRRDVRMLNDMARAKLVERGVVADGFAFKTEDGTRMFAAGDQIVFLKNEGSLGVKNGMLAKVIEAAAGGIIAEIGEGEHRQVTIEQRFYNNLDHGYATTIHKSQGATVDRVKVLASLSLDKHLTYVAMTRHREDLAVYYGRRSFAKSGGLIPILSRRNAKETTLDYEKSALCRQAFRFAEARGLHLMNVARTIAHDRLQWAVRQKQKLADLGARLAAIGKALGLVRGSNKHSIPDTIKEARPMVSGITTFPKSLDQAVEDKLAADPGLKKQWEDVSTRFQLVYAQPEAAFKAINVDTMLKDQSVAQSTLARIAGEPESFGAIKGKTGLLASRGDKQDREKAIANVPALARNLERYLRERAEAELKHETEERAVRLKVSVDIPALSSAAKQTLERVRDVIDRNDLPAGLEYALADKMVKAELEGFAKAVSERFGERTFLPLAAKDTDGKTFETVTAGMTDGQKAEVQSTWNSMRTVQQLAAYERTTEALKQAETLRQTKSQGLSLK